MNQIKKTIKKSIFLSMSHFFVCLLAGASGWDIQTLIVSVMTFLSFYMSYKKISTNSLVSVSIVAPFFLLYTISSLIVANPLNYSVWVCGIFISILSIILLKTKVKQSVAFTCLFFILLVEYFLIYPNLFTYFTMRPTPNSAIFFNTKIVDIDNKQIEIEKYKNRILLFDIWHSACLPCIEQFPEMQSLYDFFRTDTSVKIISLNVPLKKDNGKKPAQFTDQFNFEKLYFMNESEYAKFSDRVVPLILIFDKKLKCRYAGELNTGWNILIGNAKTIIRQLKKEK